MDVWWVQLRHKYQYNSEKFVSILVLVDVWWVLHSSGGVLRALTVCLDPCFGGCLVGTSLLYVLENQQAACLDPCFGVDFRKF